MLDAVAEREAVKYRDAFSREDYRRKCHGLTLWKEHRQLFPDAVESAIDYGCGTGRLVERWLAEGIDGYGVDLVPEVSVDEGTYAAHPDRFVSASLWDFEPGRVFDVGVCADVMEHIPEAYVAPVCERIAASCRRAVFTIANFQSTFEGHTLHLTLHDEAWWRSTLWVAMGGAVNVVHRPWRDQPNRYLLTWTCP